MKKMSAGWYANRAAKRLQQRVVLEERDRLLEEVQEYRNKLGDARATFAVIEKALDATRERIGISKRDIKK